MIDVRRIDANDKPLNLEGTHIVYWMTSGLRSKGIHYCTYEQNVTSR